MSYEWSAWQIINMYYLPKWTVHAIIMILDTGTVVKKCGRGCKWIFSECGNQKRVGLTWEWLPNK